MTEKEIQWSQFWATLDHHIISNIRDFSSFDKDIWMWLGRTASEDQGIRPKWLYEGPTIQHCLCCKTRKG